MSELEHLETTKNNSVKQLENSVRELKEMLSVVYPADVTRDLEDAVVKLIKAGRYNTAKRELLKFDANLFKPKDHAPYLNFRIQSVLVELDTIIKILTRLDILENNGDSTVEKSFKRRYFN